MTDIMCEGCLTRKGKTCKTKNRKHATIRACDYYPGYEDETTPFTLDEVAQQKRAIEEAERKYIDTHILIDTRVFISVDPQRAGK